MQKSNRNVIVLKAVACAAMVAMLSQSAMACTRILWNDNKMGVYVGRTMDWPTSTAPRLMVFPKGISRDGGQFDGKIVVKENPAKWTSKYGSMGTSLFGMGTIDGINEKGLAVHALFLKVTDFGDRDASKAGVQAGLFPQYILDNAANVNEALSQLEKIQPVMVGSQGSNATLHFAIEDASGDSAILEYVKGKLLVHHGRQYRIMTNDPTYDEQLANRAKYNFVNATRETPLPGNTGPKDRFIRADYFLQMLQEPHNEREAVSDVLAIARNASVPFYAPADKHDSYYTTEYRTALDLTNRVYFFELTRSPSLVWAGLSSFNLSVGAPVMELNPDDPTLAGNVTGKFKALDKTPY